MAEDKKDADQTPHETEIPQTPSEITSANLHLVDFDNLKVRLVCLVSNLNTFNSVASFLKRRGWELYVTDQLKDALAQVSTFNADFVLVSMNHKHSKIGQFPQIIRQTFNVPSIAFGEASDSKTMGAIQTSAAKYKIMGHVSGPMAQRKIKQILQEIYQVDSLNPGADNRRQQNMKEDQTIELRGSSPARSKDETRVRRNKDSRDSQNNVMIFEKNKGPSEQAEGYRPEGSSETKNDGIAYSGGDSESNEDPAVHIKPKKTESFAVKKQEQDSEMKSALQELSDEISSGQLEKETSSEIKSKNLEMQTGLGKGGRGTLVMKKETEEGATSAGSSGPDNQGDSDSGFIDTGTGVEITEAALEDGQPKSESDASNGAELSAETGGPIFEFGNKKAKDPRFKITPIDRQSFLEEATKSIAAGLMESQSAKGGQIKKVVEISIFSVCHRNHLGYFMFVGEGPTIDKSDIVNEFASLLKIYCEERGEIIDFGDFIQICCEPYEFFDNSEEGLDFALAYNYRGGEVGIKFINDEEAWAHAEVPENHEKAKIKVEQVVEDQVLNFDLFVHLKRNQKYYKIVNKDSEFNKARKDRLIDKKQNVFINESDVPTYRSYQTKNKALKVVERGINKQKKKKAS